MVGDRFVHLVSCCGVVFSTCVGNCAGMLQNKVFRIEVTSCPAYVASAVLKSMPVQEELSKLEEVLKKEVDEELAARKLARERMFIDGQVKKLADEVGLTSEGADIEPIVKKFMGFYNQATEEEKTLIREAPDFKFFLGICSYYLASQTKDESIKLFFKTLTGKEMSVENGVQLIEQSPCENAYWFMEAIKGNQ